jgi:hypothetical protein
MQPALYVCAVTLRSMTWNRENVSPSRLNSIHLLVAVSRRKAAFGTAIPRLDATETMQPWTGSTAWQRT